MGERCPFCWGQKVKPVGARSQDRKSAAIGQVIECEECEKWYWADREEEAPALFMHCETPILQPQGCYEEIRSVLKSEETIHLRRRLAEFNHLCSECPNGRFLAGPDSAARRNNSTVGAP